MARHLRHLLFVILAVIATTSSFGQTVKSLTFTPSAVLGGVSVSGEVILAAPAPIGGTVVKLASSQPFVQVPATVTVKPGFSNVLFTATTSPVPLSTRSAVTATAGASHVSTNLGVLCPVANGINIDLPAIYGGQTVTGAVGIDMPAGNAGQVVKLSSDQPFAVVPATVTVLPGNYGVEFTVKTSFVPKKSRATITGTCGGASVSVHFDVLTPGVTAVNLNPATIASGNVSSGQVSLGYPAGPGGLQVKLTSSNPVANVPATVTVPAGSSSVNFQVGTDLTSTVKTATITAFGGGTSASALLTVQPLALVSVSVNPDQVIGGQSSTGKVNLNGVTLRDQIVGLTYTGGGISLPSSVTIPAGSSSATFTVSTSPVGNDTTDLISASSAIGTVSTSIRVLAPVIATISVDPSTVLGGNQVLGTVTLTGPAAGLGRVVAITTNRPFVLVPASVTVPAGAKSTSFSIFTQPVNDLIVATIVANTGGASAFTRLNVDYQGPSSVSFNPTAVVGSQQSTLTVALKYPAGPGGFAVSLSSDSAALIVPSTVTVAEGKSVATVKVNTDPVNFTTTATATASATGHKVTGKLMINATYPTSLTLTPNSVGDGGTSTARLTLAGPAPSAGLFVGIQSNQAFVTVPNSVFFAPGQQSIDFPVKATPGKSGVAMISAAANGGTVKADLTVNVKKVVSVSLNPTSVVGGTNSTGTVTIASAASAGGFVVSLSSDKAFANVPASVTVPAGATTATFNVGTSAVGSDSTATISASGGGASASAILTVTAPRVTSVTVNPASVVGGASSTATVTLSSVAPTGGLTIAVTSNQAFATVPATVTVASGTISTTFTVATTPVTADGTVTIAASVNGSSANALLKVTAPKVLQLTLAPSVVNGGVSSTGTVTLSSAAPAGGVAVNLTSNQAFATVPSSVTVPAGALFTTFTVQTVAVATSGNAVITGTVNGGSASAALTVNAPKLVSVAVNPTSVLGGVNSTGTVTISSAAPVGGLAVTLSSDKSFASVRASVTISAGSTSATFTVVTATVAADGSATITASAGGSTATATLTVTAQKPILLALNPTSVVGGDSSTGTVTLGAPAPAGGAVVTLSSDKTFATVPTSVTVAQGSTTGTFTVSTVAVGTLFNSAVITAAYGGQSATATLAVNPPHMTSLVLNPATVAGGTSTTVTVTISSPAPVGGIQISLSSDKPFAIVPSSVTVPAGATTGSGTIGTTDVAATDVAIIGANLLGQNMIARLTVNPAATTGGLAKSAWPKFRGDSGNTGRATASPSTGTVLWKVKVGDSTLGRTASPVIGTDGTVYVGSTNNNFYAVKTDGSIKWSFPTGAPIQNAAAIAADNTIYVSSTDGKLYAINADGSQKWAYDGASQLFTDPAIGSDGTVYVGSSSGAVLAIRPDGTLKYSFKTNDAIRGCPAIAADGTIYTGSRDRNLYAIKPDGTLKWSKSAGQSFSSPTVGDDGTVYLTTYGAGIWAFANDGTLKWNNRENLFYLASPAVAKDGSLFAGVTSDHGVIGLKPDGTTAWRYGFNTDGSTFIYDVFSSLAIAADGTLFGGSQFAGTTDRIFHGIYPTGVMRWDILTGFSIDSSPAIGTDGVLYFLGSDGNLYAVK